MVQRGGDWANVTAHPSTAGVPINVLLLLSGFNVRIKGLTKCYVRTYVTLPGAGQDRVLYDNQQLYVWTLPGAGQDRVLYDNQQLLEGLQ